MTEVKPQAPRRVRASLSADRATVNFVVGTWKGSFPVERLDSWIAMYRDLAKRNSRLGGPGAYEPIYGPVVEALEKTKAKLEG